MPAIGYQMERENFINIKFHRKFMRETGVRLDYKTFKKIIVESNKEIAEIILDGNDGFRLPRHLGAIAITSFKTDKKIIDWINTNKFGKRIYHLNLNTFGKSIAINWYTIDVKQLSFAGVYKFKACRELARAASKRWKAGQQYHHWESKDFVDANRMEKILIKRSKNTE